MLIAVNTQSLVKDHLEGLGWFTYETLKRIVKQHPEHQFLFIFGKGVDDSFIFADNVKGINVGLPIFRPIIWKLKFEYLLPRVLKKHKVDLFISTDGLFCKHLPCKSLNVIHDLNFEANPQWLPSSFANYYRKNFPIWAKKANRIATVSEYSKQDIHQRYQVPLEQIDVVYNGSNHLYQAIDNETQKSTKQRYSEGKDYFLFVGSIHPRKNIDGLLLAFDTFKANDQKDMKLVIVGSKFFWDKKLENIYNNMVYTKDVIFTGHLSSEELKLVMGSALALSYVSLFEGFGIPLVEAMNAETAILTSKTTCLPEIAQDAALYVNPLDTQKIADAMLQLSTDEDLRQQLIQNGRERRKAFSWDKTAEKLWNSITQIM